MKNYILSPKGDETPHWIYCGGVLEWLPPLGKTVIGLFKMRGSLDEYEVIAPIHRMADLSDPDGAKWDWYIYEKKITRPVVAYLYVPEQLKLSKERLFCLMKNGAIYP